MDSVVNTAVLAAHAKNVVAFVAPVGARPECRQRRYAGLRRARHEADGFRQAGFAIAEHVAPHHRSASHRHGTAAGSAPESQATVEEATPTGNSVSLEQEMIKLSDTQVQYQTVTNLYAKAMGMFRTALGVRQGG